MPIVQLSDGREVEFPDGMTQDDMAAALRKLPAGGKAQPETSWPGMLANSAARGAVNVMGLPGTITEATGKYVTTPAINLVRRSLGYDPVEYPGSPIATGEQLQETLRANRILDRPGTQPTTMPQRYAAAAAEGAGAGAVAAPIVGPIALVQGIGGELGSRALGDLSDMAFPNNPGVKATAQAVGGMMGGIGAEKAIDLSVRGANAVRGIGNEVTRAYDRAGITPRIVPDITGNPRHARWLDTVASGPGGRRAIDAARQSQDDFASAIKRATANAEATPQQAGLAIQNATRNWLTKWKADSNQLWTTFRRFVPANRPIPTPHFASTIDDVLQDFGGADNLASILQPDLPRKLKLALAADLQRGQLSFKSLQSIRTRLGELQETPSAVADMSMASIKRLYGALTDDMLAGARSVSPRAEQAFLEASRHTKTGHDLIDSAVDKIIDIRNPSNIPPEKAYEWAIAQAKSGDTRLSDVAKVAGQDVFDSFAQTKMRQMAKPAARNPSIGSGGPEASSATFNTEWNKLSPEGRSILFRNIPQADDLATVAGRSVSSQSLANTSKTGATNQDLQLLVALSGILGGAGGAIGGAGGAGAGTAMGAMLPVVYRNLLARALTSPKVARMAAAPGIAQRSLLERALLSQLLADPQLSNLQGVPQQ